MPVALDLATYRAAVGHFATGVTVVTTAGPEGPAGLTANAVCSLSLDPVLLIVCLDRGSRTLAAVRHAGRLAVNVLAEDQRPVALAFSAEAPEGAKFDGVGYRLEDGLPMLDGIVAWLAGSVRDLLPGGDHVIAVTEVEHAEALGGDPLLYYRSGYRALGAGWSARPPRGAPTATPSSPPPAGRA